MFLFLPICRLLCVHALMPWLAKYRIQTRKPDALNRDPMNPLAFQFNSIRRIKTDTSPRHSSSAGTTPISTETSPRQSSSAGTTPIAEL